MKDTQKDVLFKFSPILLVFLIFLLLPTLIHACGLDSRYWTSSGGAVEEWAGSCNPSERTDWCTWAPFDSAICWKTAAWPGSCVWIVTPPGQHDATCDYKVRGGDPSCSFVDCYAPVRSDCVRFVSSCNAYGDDVSSDTSPAGDAIPESYNGYPCGCWCPGSWPWEPCLETKSPSNHYWDWSEQGCVECSGLKAIEIDFCAGVQSRDKCESGCGASDHCDDLPSGINNYHCHSGDRIYRCENCVDVYKEDCDNRDGCYNDYGDGCQYKNFYCVDGQSDCSFTASDRHTDSTDGWTQYCDGLQWKKHKLFHDWYCSGSDCADHTSWVEETLIQNCDDGNPCTNDYCDPTAGCSHSNKNNGDACPGTPGRCCDGYCDNDGITTHSDYHVNCRDGPKCLAMQEWGYSYDNNGQLCGGFNCRECSLGYCDNDDHSRCTGNCDECSGNCVAVESTCESLYKCSDCTGSGTSFSCTYDPTENEDCPVTYCPDGCSIDANPYTWDYANDVLNECIGLNTCTNNPCIYGHACADSSSGDGIFFWDGIVRTCTAECDQNSDCATGVCQADCTCQKTEDCDNGEDDDGDTLIDCADPDCAGLPGPLGVTCCQPASVLVNCGNSMCVEETCVSNICTYTDRQQCDTTECSAGTYCDSPGGNCVNPDVSSQAGEDVCENCIPNPTTPTGQHNYGETWGFEAGTPSCCEDDVNENYISTYIPILASTYEACCDSATDCVDKNGICRDEWGEEVSCGDYVDNDCDGLVDEADDDCVTPANCEICPNPDTEGVCGLYDEWNDFSAHDYGWYWFTSLQDQAWADISISETNDGIYEICWIEGQEPDQCPIVGSPNVHCNQTGEFHTLYLPTAGDYWIYARKLADPPGFRIWFKYYSSMPANPSLSLAPNPSYTTRQSQATISNLGAYAGYYVNVTRGACGVGPTVCRSYIDSNIEYCKFTNGVTPGTFLYYACVGERQSLGVEQEVLVCTEESRHCTSQAECCSGTYCSSTTDKCTRSTGGGGCPTLFVYDGKDYVKERKSRIHSEGDVVDKIILNTKPVAEDGIYSLSLKETTLPEHSYIDTVKLFVDGKEAELISAVHSKYGDVTSILKESDDIRTDTKVFDEIELKFLAPEIEGEFLFEIEGYNFWAGAPYHMVKLDINDIIQVIKGIIGLNV